MSRKTHKPLTSQKIKQIVKNKELLNKLQKGTTMSNFQEVLKGVTQARKIDKRA